MQKGENRAQLTFLNFVDGFTLNSMLSPAFKVFNQWCPEATSAVPPNTGLRRGTAVACCVRRWAANQKRSQTQRVPLHVMRAAANEPSCDLILICRLLPSPGGGAGSPPSSFTISNR